MSERNDHVDEILRQWATERPDLDSSPVAVIGRLHRVADHLRGELVAAYSRFGLSESEFDIMVTLRRSGRPFALTPGELGDQTMVTSGTITKRCDRLVELGLVTRAPSPEDGRSRIISLTAAGKDLTDTAYAAHLTNEERLLEGLSARDRDLLASLLKKWGALLGIS